MASPSSSSRAGNVHGIQFDGDDDYIHYELETCVATLAQLFLDPNDPKKYKGPMPHHIDALLQLASGLEYIHSKNLVHGDIKPENVLISVGSGGKDEIILKWANIGLTRDVSERGRGKTNQVGGNNTWLAPELQSTRKRKRDVEENNYKETAKSDVYAQGLVFGSLFLNGEHLYGSMENKNEIPQNIIKGNPINMQKIDDKLRDCYENNLLKKMLEDDTGKRMTSTQVVNQLKAIKNKIAGKEKELLELCGRDSRSDLTEKIKNLIQFGINLNAKDDGGRNALHLLCRSYSSPKLTDAIKLLIENKIDVNAKDNDGLNAIHFLCRYHSNQNLIEAIQILIQSGIDAKATTNDGSNALHYLYRYNSNPNLLDAIKILTKLGLDLMAEDNNGWSALYYSHNKDKKEMKIWFDRDVLLGQGYFGTVFKGKFGGREVAVKRVEVHRVKEREEDAMMKLGHPNIVKLLHCESDKDFRYYALELCDASLDKLFLDQSDPKKYKGPLPRHIEIFYQLADGLKYIHSENLIHRDIKPENVLISVRSTGQRNEVTIKWADFGLSKPVNERGTFPLSGIKGTKIWFAPETVRLLRQPVKEEDTARGTVKSDIFAQALVFGCLLLNGKHLYGGGEKEIHDNLIGKKPVNMQNIDAKLRQFYENHLLNKMLEDDPQKRITSEQVVEQLKFINKMFTEKEEELRQLCQHDSSSRLIEKINDLIQLGIDVNAKELYRRNALHYLCKHNSNSNLIDAIQLLIQRGIDVNATNWFGQNALHCLCENYSNSNLIDAIQLLIQLGIDVNAKDGNGWNALHHLCRFNSETNLIDAIQLLIQLGVDVNAKDKIGCNALHYLCLCENNSNSNLIDAIRLLIQLGIDVNAKDNDGYNALHYLCLCMNNSNSNLIDAIRLLIQLGIPVVSDDHDARSIFRRNYFIRNKDEILKLLDEAAPV
ncbi:hypothetical protein GHT06_014508 [Daphnia sinensis]|uniref:Protein kinase domain-containing protein n=1 Tax=Daphnia sinensis TaxID=1820382 RepID=A0AAD5PWE0_9CRUS|nr:hypothetical protein GHT06_014508 [Daphnia sinensis]